MLTSIRRNRSENSLFGGRPRIGKGFALASAEVGADVAVTGLTATWASRKLEPSQDITGESIPLILRNWLYRIQISAISSVDGENQVV